MTTRLKPLAVAVTLTALSVILVSISSPVGVSADPPPHEVKNEFEGKVVTVYLSDPQEGTGQILTDAELLTIGGRLMLVGTGADTGVEGDWTSGLRVGIAWDSIDIYYAMTQKQFDEKVKQQAK